jgi:hypothetical protein
MYLGPTWVLYKLVGNFAMTGLTRNPNQTNGGPSVGDVTGPPFPLSLFSSRKFFGELAGGLTVKESDWRLW